MIIITQDRKHNWIYENLEDVYVPDEVVEDEDWCVKISTLRGDTYVIGYYKTEGRAQEVLKEIQIVYANIEMLKIPSVKIHEVIASQEMFRNIVYQMPKE